MKKAIILFFIILLYIVLISRIFYLSVLKYEEKIDKVAINNNNKRLNILDRNGTILASNIDVKNLYLNKDLIDDKEFTSLELSKIIDIDYDTILNKINTSKGRFILIKKNIFPQEEAKIKNIPIASIVFENDFLRFYPHNNLFSHVIGYVDIDKNGIIGVEEYYDNYLKHYSNKELKLTLDLKLQESMRDELITAYNEYKAEFATGILMESKTGNILAMVSIPDFNPNEVTKSSSMFNFATYGNYELGSVFKIFTFANGIENADIKKNTIFDISNEIKYGDFIINDINSITRRGKITTLDAFSISSNLATIQIAKKLGIKKQIKFFENIGLLEKINNDINQVNLPLQPRRWSDINLMTISYGYGIALSPLHILTASNGIINNGNYITPRFSYNFDKQIKKRVVSEYTSNIMKDLFYSVVNNGTGKLVRIDGINIGGKTGTARKNSKSGGYIEGEHLASFVGSFPLESPEYSIIVVIDRPKVNDYKDGTGGTVAAKITKNIILKSLPFLNIKPNLQM